MSVSTRTKWEIWRRDKGCCFYCNEPLTWDTKTFDHVIPKSKGGGHQAWNLVLCCLICNQVKGDEDPTTGQLEMVMARQILYKSRIALGQAIEVCKNYGKLDDAKRLRKLQEKVEVLTKIG